MEKYVLLTGANGGIGKKTLELLLQDGYRVVALDIDNSNIKDLATLFIKCDISNKVHRNRATLRHNPSNPRHSPNRSLMSIHCPICRKDRSRMREEQMICRSSRTED